MNYSFRGLLEILANLDILPSEYKALELFTNHAPSDPGPSNPGPSNPGQPGGSSASTLR